jgi:uncharacterized protein YbjT (DUF2867 family)
MYLVVGATGLVGEQICRLLTDKGEKVRGLVRAGSDVERVARLKKNKVDTVLGDLNDASSVASACKGVATVISTASASPAFKSGDTIQGVDFEGERRLLTAAKTAGVKEFVFVSFRQSKYSHPLWEAKQATEGSLRQSGLAYTVWQPSFFMDVWFGPALGFDWQNGKVRVYGSGRSKMTWIHSADVARLVVGGLSKEATRNATIQIGGPEPLSYSDVIAIYEELGGKKLAIERVPESAFRQQFESAGDPASKSFAGLMAWIANGDVVEMTQTLEYLPVKLTSVRDFAKRQLAR